MLATDGTHDDASTSEDLLIPAGSTRMHTMLPYCSLSVLIRDEGQVQIFVAARYVYAFERYFDLAL